MNQVSSTLDHSSITIKLNVGSHRCFKKNFCFENSCWLLQPTLNDGWNNTFSRDLIQKLEACSNDMNLWGKSIWGINRDKIEACRKELEFIHQSNDVEATSLYSIVNDKLCNLIAREESFWRHRAKIYWLKDGDINSKFFHWSTATTRKKNKFYLLSNTRW